MRDVEPILDVQYRTVVDISGKRCFVTPEWANPILVGHFGQFIGAEVLWAIHDMEET